LDAIRDIIYQVIPKLLFKNNNKKVSEIRGYNGIIYGSYKMVGCPIVK
jgi:hypothetical protein